MSNELKVVISLKESKAAVGVQAPECDPVFFGLEGDLQATLNAVPEFVDEAKTRWETSKLCPKCESPLPSQEQPAATTSRASTGSSQKAAAQRTQNQMF